MEFRNYYLVLDQIQEITLRKSSDALKDEIIAKCEELGAVVEKTRYLKLPLVGVFNAGKSSLINMFLENGSLLPIDNMPETAIAYEIYYDTTERVDVYRGENKVKTVSFAEIKGMDTEPGDVAKVYVNNENVKKLNDKGIILVDMPGIASGLDRHDAAIQKYIQEGSAFVLVVDAEQGSLRASTLLFLEELRAYNLSPAIIISKVDKKPVSEVSDILEYVGFQASKVMDEKPYIATVSSANKDTAGLATYLDSIDVNTIRSKKLNALFTAFIDKLAGQIDNRIATRIKDIDNINEKIEKLKTELESLKSQRSTQTPDHSAQSDSVEAILEDIKMALDVKSDDIAHMIVDGVDAEEMKSAVGSIIKARLINALNEENKKYVDKVIVDIKFELEDNDLIGEMIPFIGPALDEAAPYLARLTEFIATRIPKIGPILAKVLDYLPEILISVVKFFAGGKMIATAQTKFKEAIPQILDGLRPSVENLVSESQGAIFKLAENEKISSVERIVENLEEKLGDSGRNKAEVETEIAELKSSVEKLNALKTQLS